MTGNTHLSLGVAAGAVAVGVTGSEDQVLTAMSMVVVSSLGAMLPDIDEDGSTLNNLLFRSIRFRSAALAIAGAIFVLLALIKNLELWVMYSGLYAMAVAFIPHRSFTHSFLSLALVTWITYQAHPLHAWAMAAGYLSHLLADACTSGGIPLFWPWKKRMGLKSLGVNIRSGDTFDKITGKVAMYGGCIALVWLFFRDASYDSFFHSALEQLEAVKGLLRG
ncbi:inner membrane protein [Melghirimyces profundicolus]|uniref:Inner membrane protein n=1 Tax=Melghirimyces profundicolus TaxID=1242148 RepID=A0A2T6C4F3_9BACL|nr:metal-dependent hydrolase [Melghirimyces profundicolus]PTX63188.1 inner membrane protein [Melghirimyces profundicolus]